AHAGGKDPVRLRLRGAHVGIGAGRRGRAPTTTLASRSGSPRTGRVVTAAGLVMSISFAASIAAQVPFMRMFRRGLTPAVLVDAELVRMVLLPAVMHVMGERNWWSPDRRRRFTTASESKPPGPGWPRRRRRIRHRR